MIEPRAREALRACLGDAVAFDVPMARHTSLRVGGPAAALASPRDAVMPALAALQGEGWINLLRGLDVNRQAIAGDWSPAPRGVNCEPAECSTRPGSSCIGPLAPLTPWTITRDAAMPSRA